MKYEAGNSPLGNAYIKSLRGSDKIFAELLHIDLTLKKWARAVTFVKIADKVFLNYAKMDYDINYKQPKKNLDLDLSINTELLVTDIQHPIINEISKEEEWKRKNLVANLPSDFDSAYFVGYMWKGKAVIRSRPPRKRSGSSPLQKQQQEKFVLMHKFLKPLLSILNVTYNNLAIQMTGFNKAFSYNVKNAITGDYPDLKIDYSMVLLGRGDLPNVMMPVSVISKEGKLVFNWTDNSRKGKAKAFDKVFVAVYCEENGKWEYGLNLATRSAGTCSIDIKDFADDIKDFTEKEVHSYIGFISEDGKDVTNSLYLGMIKYSSTEPHVTAE